MSKRFLSPPPRIQIRELDSTTGSYPTISRTGDPYRSGTYASYFDDTRTILFLSASSTINLPSGLSSGSVHLDSRVTGSLGVTLGTARKGVADSTHLVRRRDPGENLGSFYDNRIDLRTSSFYLTGTAVKDVGFGFSSPLGSKVQIVINTAPSENTNITRIKGARGQTNGEFSGPASGAGQVNKTGFVYFNFLGKRWEQIGDTDPATGNRHNFDYAIFVDVNGKHSHINNFEATGTGNFPCQFSMSPQIIANSNPDDTSLIFSVDDAKTFGYHRIGTPITTCFAPFDTKYHATSSQVLKLSDHIRHPFYLEKVVVEIPVEVRRTHHRDLVANSNSRIAKNDQRRDMDNYVFFMYRQEHMHSPGSSRDSLQDVSSSLRYLICSASMCFYNSLTVASGGAWIDSTWATPSTELKNKFPLHSPAFKYDFNMPVDANDTLPATNQEVKFFSGTIRLETVPAIASRQSHGVSSFPAEYAPNISGSLAIARWQNFWPGGTSYEPFMEAETFTGKSGLSASIIASATFTQHRDALTSIQVQHLDIRYDIFSNVIADNVVTNKNYTAIYDPRPLRGHMGGRGSREMSLAALYPAVSNVGADMLGEQSIVTPYLLFPTDEIIFGIDAGISDFANGGLGRNSTTSITGSLMRIITGSSTITLYGSLVKEEKEFFPMLNQPLTSPAIHEDVHFGDVPFDEFDIEPISSFSGSNIDDIISGSMSFDFTAENERRVSGRISKGEAGVTASFFRGQRAVSGERFYDTMMPDLETFLVSYNGAQKISTSSYNFSSSLNTYEFTLTKKFLENEDKIKYPYQFDIPRRTSDNSVLVLTGTDSNYKFLTSGSQILRMLFLEGFRETQVGLITDTVGGGITVGFNHSPVSGAMRYKYGIMNIKPQYSQMIFKRNKYGQFRDMLEQRHDGKFHISSLFSSDELSSFFDTNSAAVNVKFVTTGAFSVVTNSLSTNSSNKSFECTSSLPYFDGLTSN